MHSKLLTGRRTALITERVTKIYKTSEDNSEIVGYAERNVIMELQYCKSQFCKVAHSDLKGWIKRDSFWGLIEDEKLNWAIFKNNCLFIEYKANNFPKMLKKEH